MCRLTEGQQTRVEKDQALRGLASQIRSTSQSWRGSGAVHKTELTPQQEAQKQQHKSEAAIWAAAEEEKWLQKQREARQKADQTHDLTTTTSEGKTDDGLLNTLECSPLGSLLDEDVVKRARRHTDTSNGDSDWMLNAAATYAGNPARSAVPELKLNQRQSVTSPNHNTNHGTQKGGEDWMSRAAEKYGSMTKPNCVEPVSEEREAIVREGWKSLWDQITHRALVAYMLMFVCVALGLLVG